jgi:hypothetical protein
MKKKDPIMVWLDSNPSRAMIYTVIVVAWVLGLILGVSAAHG